jgi:hypothetical protein
LDFPEIIVAAIRESGEATVRKRKGLRSRDQQTDAAALRRDFEVGKKVTIVMRRGNIFGLLIFE